MWEGVAVWEDNRMKVIRYLVHDRITSKGDKSKSHYSKSQMAKASGVLSLSWDSGETHFSHKSLSDVWLSSEENQFWLSMIWFPRYQTMNQIRTGVCQVFARDEAFTTPRRNRGLGLFGQNLVQWQWFVCSWLCHNAMWHWASHFFLNSSFSICKLKELDNTISEIPLDMVERSDCDKNW